MAARLAEAGRQLGRRRRGERVIIGATPPLIPAGDMRSRLLLLPLLASLALLADCAPTCSEPMPACAADCQLTNGCPQTCACPRSTGGKDAGSGAGADAGNAVSDGGSGGADAGSDGGVAAMDAGADAGLDAGADAGSAADAGQLSLFAGQLGVAGSADGDGGAASFSAPMGLALDGAGNLYVADSRSAIIRKVSLANGEVTTLAGSPNHLGSTNGVGAAASFDSPHGLACDGAGHLFVADTTNEIVRQIDLASGQVTTLAGEAGHPGKSDGVGSAALFDHPMGLAADGAGHLFVGDSYNFAVRQIDVAQANVTTLAGRLGIPGAADGIGADAGFSYLEGLASDGAGQLFVADSDNFAVRAIDTASAAVTTLAGTLGHHGDADGVGPAASFSNPVGIAFDAAGVVYVADGSRVRRIDVATRTVTSPLGVVGQAGVILGPAPAGLAAPWGLEAVPGLGLLVADSAAEVLLSFH